MTRIEQAADRATARRGDTQDRDLADRHERLRAAVAGSLRQLDALLAGREP